MADLPFDQQQQPQPPQAQPFQQQVPPQAPQDISSQWSNFLSQPGAGQLMLGMGINLMQPRHFGDTFGSQLGRAIGAGAEAASSGELLESKVGELDARSKAALERSAYAGERLGMQQMIQDQLNKRSQQAQETQVYKSYVADLDNAEKRHKDRMATYLKEKGEWDLAPARTRGPEPQRPPDLPPRPTFRDWLKVRAPELHDRMYPATQQKPAETPVDTGGE